MLSPIKLPLLLVLLLLALAGAWFLTVGGGARGPASAFGHEPDQRVADVRFRDAAGARHRLLDMAAGAQALVVVMRDAGCPVSQKYGPKLGRLEGEYGARGVRFLYVNVNEAQDAAAVDQERDRFGFEGPYLLDPDWRLARVLRPRATGEVFVLDPSGTLRYRGQVDDQYGLTHSRAEPTAEPLRGALDAVLAGEAVPVSETVAEGCLLDATAHEPPARGVTYHNRISRIVQANCQTCHRAGGIAPFPLESYTDVRAYAPMIAFMVEQGRMPPWFAHAGVGEWANDRRLRDSDLRDLLAWIAAGTPQGDADEAPSPLGFADGWSIGQPDAVIEIPEAFTIPAEGVVDYQYMYVKTDFLEDRWVRAYELRPTARQVTHHVLVFLEEPGRKSARDAAPGEPVWQGGIRGFFAEYAPGSVGVTFPEGTAKRLPKGAWLKFQIHYNPNGAEAVDRSALGLVFADAPPEREIETRSAFQTRFVIPPYAERHEVAGEHVFERAGTVANLFPHMHNRGAAFRMELVAADGAAETILDIPRYDFNWQVVYRPARPIRVEPGMKLRATGWFDNSEANPANPDPSAEVRFGEQTFEEMMIGYFDFIPDPPPLRVGDE